MFYKIYDLKQGVNIKSKKELKAEISACEIIISHLEKYNDEMTEKAITLAKGIRACFNSKAFANIAKAYLKDRDSDFFTAEQSKEISIALDVADDITDIYQE